PFIADVGLHIKGAAAVSLQSLQFLLLVSIERRTPCEHELGRVDFGQILGKEKSQAAQAAGNQISATLPKHWPPGFEHRWLELQDLSFIALVKNVLRFTALQLSPKPGQPA